MVLVEALQKPIDDLNQASQPAEQAGIFLSETHNLLTPGGTSAFEAVARVQALERAGRLIGQTAAPGEVTFHYLPESQEQF